MRPVERIFKGGTPPIFVEVVAECLHPVRNATLERVQRDPYKNAQRLSLCIDSLGVPPGELWTQSLAVDRAGAETFIRDVSEGPPQDFSRTNLRILCNALTTLLRPADKRIGSSDYTDVFDERTLCLHLQTLFSDAIVLRESRRESKASLPSTGKT